jgi:hypothetical protein
MMKHVAAFALVAMASSFVGFQAHADVEADRAVVANQLVGQIDLLTDAQLEEIFATNVAEQMRAQAEAQDADGHYVLDKDARTQLNDMATALVADSQKPGFRKRVKDAARSLGHGTMAFLRGLAYAGDAIGDIALTPGLLLGDFAGGLYTAKKLHYGELALSDIGWKATTAEIVGALAGIVPMAIAMTNSKLVYAVVYPSLTASNLLKSGCISDNKSRFCGHLSWIDSHILNPVAWIGNRTGVGIHNFFTAFTGNRGAKIACADVMKNMNDVVYDEVPTDKNGNPTRALNELGTFLLNPSADHAGYYVATSAIGWPAEIAEPSYRKAANGHVYFVNEDPKFYSYVSFKDEKSGCVMRYFNDKFKETAFRKILKVDNDGSFYLGRRDYTDRRIDQKVTVVTHLNSKSEE